MSFMARYGGTCEECGASIHVGDWIQSTEYDGYAHAQCVEQDTSDREPCPTCWLTICDCTEDGHR